MTVLGNIPLATHDTNLCVWVHACMCTLISVSVKSDFLVNLPMTIVFQIMVLQWASDCIVFAVVCLWLLQMPIALKKYTGEFHILYQHIFQNKQTNKKTHIIFRKKKSDFLFVCLICFSHSFLLFPVLHKGFLRSLMFQTFIFVYL